MALSAPASPPARRMRPTSALFIVGPVLVLGLLGIGADAGALGVSGRAEDAEDAVDAEGENGLSDSRGEADGGGADWNGESPRSSRRKTKSAGEGAQVSEALEERGREERERGGRTAPKEDAARDAVVDRRHEAADIEAPQALLASDLARDAERAELLARDRLDLGARLDDLDLRAEGRPTGRQDDLEEMAQRGSRGRRTGVSRRAQRAPAVAPDRKTRDKAFGSCRSWCSCSLRARSRGMESVPCTAVMNARL